MKNYTTFALVLALTLPSAAFAAAQGVYGKVEGSAETSADVSGAVNSGLGTEVKGVVNARIGAEATTSGSPDTSEDTSSAPGVGTRAIGGIVVTRADVDAGATAAINVSPASVYSDADLSGFVAAQITADKNVAEIEASSDNVSVTYKQKAKLFGLIPVTVNATAIVLADGSVDVQYPWYAFLMVTNEGSLEAAIEDRVGAIVSANAVANAVAEVGASLELSSSAQAMLISEVRSIMDQELAADIAADAAVAAKGGGVVEVE